MRHIFRNTFHITATILSFVFIGSSNDPGVSILLFGGLMYLWGYRYASSRRYKR